ncbi:TOPRIM nucleotidyl transferase/hydrolase domain-containing protein [Paenibacillus sp. TAF58]
MAKRPNFDILKLISNRVILVEGPCEEMFINTQINLMKVQLSEIEIITIGPTKYLKTF